MDASGISHTVYSFIKYGVISLLSLSAIILIATSILVRDTYWIQKNPKFFLSETLIMGYLTAFPILYISYTRGGTISKTVQDFIILFLKIIFIHITFQLSGVYSVLFPKSAPPS